jgi:hypothetical protein
MFKKNINYITYNRPLKSALQRRGTYFHPLPFFFDLKRQLLHVSISDEVICGEVSWQRF